MAAVALLRTRARIRQLKNFAPQLRWPTPSTRQSTCHRAADPG